MYFIPEGEEDEEEEAVGGMEVEEQPGLIDYVARLYRYIRDGAPQKPLIREKEWEHVNLPQEPLRPFPVIKKRSVVDVEHETQDEMVRIKKRTTAQATQQARAILQYVGNKSLADRKALFLAYFSPDQNTSALHDHASQNPYVAASWHTSAQITRINMGYVSLLKRSVSHEEFELRYVVSRLGQRDVRSITMPTLYLVEPTNKSQFRDVLYGANDLVMKVIPLVNRNGILPDDELEQIYNEIKASFFLNELLYGYENVLSIHFMCIVDWFQASRRQLQLPKNERTDPLLHQIVIAERAHRHLDDFLFMYNSLETLRTVLFQILHALETAWYTHQYTHNDLHMGNVMLRAVAHEESPFRDKNFVYKRLGRQLWYVLEKEHLHNHIVKLIDFGRSRLYAPGEANHTADARHTHSQLIGPDMPEIGLPRHDANRQIDVRSLFLTLIMLSDDYWRRMGEADANTVFDFVERDVLDFKHINRLIDIAPYMKEYGSVQEERRRNAKGVLTARNMRRCFQCFSYLSHRGVYRYTNDGMGGNVTTVLDSDFFRPLTVLPEGDTERSFSITKTVQDYIVVSFLTEGEDIRMRPPPPKQKSFFASSITTAMPQRQLRCAVCHGEARHFNREKNGNVVPLCSDVCAQFKYLFAGKTVLR